MSTSFPVHPRTGLTAIGWRKPRPGCGETEWQPIWPVRGGDGNGDSGGSGSGSGGGSGSGSGDGNNAGTGDSGGGQGGDGGQGGKNNGGDGNGQGGTPSKVDGEFDFPVNTPLAEMTPQQQSEYWRHKSRKHEQRANSRSDYDDVKKKAEKYDEIEQANKSELEKANEKATGAEQRADTAELSKLKLDVALEKAPDGMSPKDVRDWAQRLTGTTREELQSDAEAMFSRIPASTAGDGGSNGGRTGPRVPRSGTGGGTPSKGSVAAGREAYEARRGKNKQ